MISSVVTWTIISIYLFSLLWITVFSFGQLHLAWIYRKKKHGNQKTSRVLKQWPKVTIQLPIYNEKYVVERLLDAMVAMDYPSDKLIIQILDDSDDETTDIIEKYLINKNLKDKSFSHIRRAERIGYKAGALAYGLRKTDHEFIAIFDADFVPSPDFLKNALTYFDHPNIGMVQTKWDHLNENYSLLTQLQAFGLNAHFSVEQMGRNLSNSFINFNGTGGIWRKKCIEDAGGWSDDTLTEDLDLSYRAQLKGWQFKFIESITCPAELPVMVPAIKSQQYRWNKGAAESARKHLLKIFRSSLPVNVKLRATLHLLNSSVFVFLLVAALLSIPMLYIKAHNPSLAVIFHAGSVFITGFIAIGIFYWISVRANKKSKQRLRTFSRQFPLFMIFSMGLSLHNSIAIMEGWFGKKTPFIRTPKFNIKHKGESWKGNIYIGSVNKLHPSTWMELLLASYFLFGIGYGLYLVDWGLMLWHAMLASGFFSMSFLSIKSQRNEASS